ncbi:beta-amyrin 16-alpha-hydroxylase CYP87D16-like [Primulina huaijiensis]|uniref:beta-amyrin 16-alpha-hydroxylase CYP87D16-like n=1 Tax=Primulina huaijiensis TaxID=1492673 RepID=UPI003CC794FD
MRGFESSLNPNEHIQSGKQVNLIPFGLSHVACFVGTLVALYVTHWIYRWRNPKCNGVLPPGSMGLPLIGETIQLVIPSASLDLPPFIKNRMKRCVTFMAIDFAAKQIFSGDTPDKISDMFRDLVEGLMSFPINIPGTAHHKCLQIHKKVREMMRDVVTKRLAGSEGSHGDLLDHIIDDKNTKSFLNEDFIVQLMFGLLFVTSDSISTTLALAFKLLEENPLVMEELILQAKHEKILKKREDPESSLTWNEYKSMSFTLQVINEVLRLGNIAPGFFSSSFERYPSQWYLFLNLEFFSFL